MGDISLENKYTIILIVGDINLKNKYTIILIVGDINLKNKACNITKKYRKKQQKHSFLH